VEITISCSTLGTHLRHGDLYPVPPGGCSSSVSLVRPNPFGDIRPGDYFYERVLDLYETGAISGYGDGTFRPYNLTTRAQLVKIVVLAFEVALAHDEAQRFSDVPASHPFFEYVQAASSRHLVAGYSDDTFRPYNNVTRGQIAKIVVGATGAEMSVPSVPSFTDVPAGSTYYTLVETGYALGFLNGYADGTFRPYVEATRGQVAKVVDLARPGK
jgi:hypothetical protein